MSDLGWHLVKIWKAGRTVWLTGTIAKLETCWLFCWPSLKYFMVPNWVYVNAPPVKRHSIEPTELWLLYNILTSLMTVALCRTHLNLRPTCSDLPGPHSGECSRDNKWIMTYRELYSKVLWSFGHILTHCVMSPTLSQHRSGCTL